MVPLVSKYYTVIISKSTGKAKAICYQMDGQMSNKPRANAAARSGNFFHTMEEATIVADEINQLFINHANGSK